MSQGHSPLKQPLRNWLREYLTPWLLQALLSMGLSLSVLLIQGMLLSVVAPEFLASGQTRSFKILSVVSIAVASFLCGTAVVRAFRWASATAVWAWILPVSFLSFSIIYDLFLPAMKIHQHPVLEEFLFSPSPEMLFLVVYPALASVMYSAGARMSIFRRGMGDEQSS